MLLLSINYDVCVYHYLLRCNLVATDPNVILPRVSPFSSPPPPPESCSSCCCTQGGGASCKTQCVNELVGPQRQKTQCIGSVGMQANGLVSLTISCWRGVAEVPNGGQKGTGLGSSTLDRTTIIKDLGGSVVVEGNGRRYHSMCAGAVLLYPIRIDWNSLLQALSLST